MKESYLKRKILKKKSGENRHSKEIVNYLKLKGFEGTSLENGNQIDKLEAVGKMRKSEVL